MQNLAALITLSIYGVVLIAIGAWAARRARSEDAFLLGGRGLGPWVAGLAYSASSSSAWVLLGFSGFVFVAGTSALWMAPGILAGYVAVWLGAGHVLQKSSREKGHLTLTDFLAEYADTRLARAVRIVASLMIAFLFAYYIAAQFQGAGQAFNDLFGTGLATGVLIGAGVIVAYTFLGGFLAVSTIDTIQGLIMALVAVVLPTVAFFAVGGVAGIAAGVEAAGPGYLDPVGGRVGWIAIGFLVGTMSVGFASLGQPHLVAWIMATRDRKARIAGLGVALGWGACVFTGMGVLGLAGRALYGGDMAGESLFFSAASDLLPAIFAGVVAAATLSAIMSTVDSQLLVVGGAISHDLGVSKALGDRPVFTSRAAIAVVSLVAIFITLNAPATIFDRVLFAWSALGATFGPIVVARACGLRPGGWAVLGAMAIGFGLSIGYEFLWDPGPGAVATRTIPWIGAAVPLCAAALIQAYKRRRRLGEAM